MVIKSIFELSNFNLKAMNENFISNDGGMSAAGFNEERDCAVRAYSFYKKISYEDSHKKFKANGRKDRRATFLPVIEKVIGLDGLHVKNLKKEDRPTLNRLMKLYPNKRIYAVTRNHAVAIINGVIYDTWKPGKKTKIIDYWVKDL
jgi:hypothetical protein